MTILSKIGVTTLAIAGIATNIATFYWLWVWFITPIFHIAVPAVYQLFGLMLFIVWHETKRMVSTPTIKSEPKSGYTFVDNTIKIMMVNGLIMLLGWVVQLFA